MRAEGQEGWVGRSLLCLFTVACACLFVSAWPFLLCVTFHLRIKLQFNIWRPSDPWGNAWMCRAQRQNPSLSSWKAGFLYTHAGCWQFVWSQETKSWVECVRLSILKPVCVHQHSWLAGLRYCWGLWASRTLCVRVIPYTLVLDLLPQISLFFIYFSTIKPLTNLWWYST